MIAVVDYGVNNLASVVRALGAGGHQASLTSDPDEVRRADRVLVPGVGNFGQASRTLSEEAPEARGLGLLPGRVRRFSNGLHVPHVGWARVDLTESGRSHALLGPAFGNGAQFFYHVHSYYPTGLPDQAVLGTGDYGGVFPTLVGRGTVIGAQFHPEKSQQAGIVLLSAFARWKP